MEPENITDNTTLYILQDGEWKPLKISDKLELVKMKEITLVVDGEEIKAMVNEKEISKLAKKEEDEWPQVGDTYWFADSYGEASFSYFFKNSIYDRVRTLMGNMYRTKEEAKNAVRAQKLITAVAKRRKELNEDWKPNKDGSSYAWFLAGGGEEEGIYYEPRKTNTGSSLGFYKERTSAAAIIEEFYDELKWYFMNYIVEIN